MLEVGVDASKGGTFTVNQVERQFFPMSPYQPSPFLVDFLHVCFANVYMLYTAVGRSVAGNADNLIRVERNVFDSANVVCLPILKRKSELHFSRSMDLANTLEHCKTDR